MRRCCPDSCGTGVFLEMHCNAFSGSGTCVYPNQAQCRPDRKLQNIVLLLKLINNYIMYDILYDSIFYIFLALKATCKDGIKNQNEEEIDCGGPCPACGKQSQTRHYS